MAAVKLFIFLVFSKLSAKIFTVEDNKDNQLKDEFEHIQETIHSVPVKDVGKLQCNKSKNRFQNVTPCMSFFVSCYFLVIPLNIF